MDKRGIKDTHRLFVDDFKVYQQSHKFGKEGNKTIVHAVIRTCYGIANCAKTYSWWIRLQLCKGELKTIDPNQKEFYKFLEEEQDDEVTTKNMYKRNAFEEIKLWAAW